MTNLTQAWTTASAALPNGWRIVGILHADLYAELAKFPAYLDLAATYPDQWVAVAEGPSGDPGEVGQGENPQQALLHLARILEPIRGSASGSQPVVEKAGKVRRESAIFSMLPTDRVASEEEH